jgi:hypothetical protein
MPGMRTTADLPDELYRSIKAAAALRGRKFKDLVEEGSAAWLEALEPETSAKQLPHPPSTIFCGIVAAWSKARPPIMQPTRNIWRDLAIGDRERRSIPGRSSPISARTRGGMTGPTIRESHPAIAHSRTGTERSLFLTRAAKGIRVAPAGLPARGLAHRP